MTRMLAATVLLAGCTKDPDVDPFDPTQEAVVPSFVQQSVAGQEDACASVSTIPQQAKVATTFFAGYYQWDATDLAGNEFWLLYPDPELAATGFTECTVVWDVFGTQVESTGAADYAIQISASVDQNQSDCIEDELGQPVYVGEEQFNITYDVVENSNGSLQIFFQSGNLLGTGEWDNRSLTWVSQRDCKIF